MQIFHRIDDVQMRSDEMEMVLDYFGRHVREFAVAVIPCGFSKSMAQLVSAYGNCHVYQHGYQHINRVASGWFDEFPDSFPSARTKVCLDDGKHRLEDLFQRKIRGYVPPWNNTGLNTVQILDELGFEIYSAQRNNTHVFRSNRDIDIDVVEAYTPKIRYRALETVVDNVKVLGRADGEIGILYHFKNASMNSLMKIFRLVDILETLQCGNAISEVR